MATMPAAVDGDMVLTESNAILQYGADLTQPNSAYPQDLKKRALINAWLLWEVNNWFGTCYIYLVQNVVMPLMKSQPDQAVIDKEAPNFHKLAAILEAHLSKHKWLGGDDVSIADIAVASPMHLWKASKLPLDKYPHITKWMTEGIEKLPAWQKTQGAVESALLPGTSSQTNGSSTANGTSQGEVRATFNYTKDVSPKLTEIYFYETDKAKDVHEPGDAPVEVVIRDGWHKVNDFTLDKSGFSVNSFKTEYNTWEDEEKTRAEFYPEVADFLKRELGAKRVLIFDHTIRMSCTVSVCLAMLTICRNGKERSKSHHSRNQHFPTSSRHARPLRLHS